MMSGPSQPGVPPPAAAAAAPPVSASVATAVTSDPNVPLAPAKVSAITAGSSAVPAAATAAPTSKMVNNSVDPAAAAARAAAMAAAGKGVGIKLGTMFHAGAGHPGAGRRMSGAAMAAPKTKAGSAAAAPTAPAVPVAAVPQPALAPAAVAAVAPASVVAVTTSTSVASNIPQPHPQHLQHPAPHPPALAAHLPVPNPTATFTSPAQTLPNTTTTTAAAAAAAAAPTTATIATNPQSQQPQSSSTTAPSPKIPPNVTFPLKRSCAAMGLARDGKPLTEKKLRRLEKNRQSARECRRRKREAAQNLEKEINVLEGENLRLRLQLQIGEEAENSSKLEQERLMEGLDDLLKSGSASESDIYATIEQYKEKFADYGRNRRSAIEFHLRNLARLLMPTTTTSVAIRALHGGTGAGVVGGGESGAAPTTAAVPGPGSSSAGATAGGVETKVEVEKVSPLVPAINNGVAASVPTMQNATDAGTAVAESKAAGMPNTDGIVNPAATKSGENTEAASVPSAAEPKALFKYLVNYLDVSPSQAAALKDSRSVARELDSALVDSLGVLEELRSRLTKCGEDLEAEFNSVRAILSPTQAAKFLIWVANNGACMHMLNELWSKVYPDLGSTEEDDEDEAHT